MDGATLQGMRVHRGHFIHAFLAKQGTSREGHRLISCPNVMRDGGATHWRKQPAQIKVIGAVDTGTGLRHASEYVTAM